MRSIYLNVAILFMLAACSDSEGGFGNGSLGADGYQGSGFGQSDVTSSAFFKESIGDHVLFKVDEYTLNEAAKTALNVQAKWLIDNPGFVIIIEGHADERGTREYNLALGFRRSQSVQEYLVARGVSGLRLKTRSYGKERPVEICSVERCYSKNRRAVTILASGSS
jgi:peptidoglycan-associated lipoprotein